MERLDKSQKQYTQKITLMSRYNKKRLLENKSNRLMPLINVKISSSAIPNANELLKELSTELANLTMKPEKYVMSLLQTDVSMTFGGTEDPCCYVEIKSIGALRPNEMTHSFCKLIESKTGIPANRIYIGFEDVAPSQWGFNGKSFGQ